MTQGFIYPISSGSVGSVTAGLVFVTEFLSV
jgi:hypothetical protein